VYLPMKPGGCLHSFIARICIAPLQGATQMRSILPIPKVNS